MKHPLVFLTVFLVPTLFAQEAPPAAGTAEVLTIERAVSLAIERNERAAIAQTTVEAAEARVRRARTAFLPRVDIGGNLRGDYTDRPERTLATSALLTQPIFDARAFPLYRAQRFERDAVRLTATESKRLLGYDAAAVFLGTLSFEQVLRAAEHRRDFAQTNLNDVRARFEAGLVSSNDVTRAELELATAVRGVAQAAGDVQASRIELENLLRVDVAALAAPTALLDAANDPPALEPSLIANAQQRRSDLAAQRARVEASRAFAEEPNARFIPSVLLNAQTRNVNDRALFSNRENEGFVGLSFAWPVFDSGLRNAERAERTALLRGEQLELELAMRDVERELRSASVQLTTEQASLREATAALVAARRNTEETNALYREGLASALELADATQRLFEAEVAEVTARYRMALAYLRLREANGDTPMGATE
ncbi:MAG TPA: TolC family protein [Thermoanaerobaculia bacterium]|nr:TolC family protein [Thermoanaerobaculia bacterium]